MIQPYQLLTPTDLRALFGGFGRQRELTKTVRNLLGVSLFPNAGENDLVEVAPGVWLPRSAVEPVPPTPEATPKKRFGGAQALRQLQRSSPW